MTDSIYSANAALGAYRSTQTMPAEADGGEAVAGPSGDFASLLSEASTSAIDQVREVEQVMAEGLLGERTTQEVVQATLELEQTVKLTVSIRDKLVEAYQDIMRMPI
ncbi:flagellar hook-basal body complex protein FliE [Roseivivax sp.]